MADFSGTYSVFGLVVKSDFPLPGLHETTGEADLRVCQKRIKLSKSRLRLISGVEMDYAPSEIRLQVPLIGNVEIRAGREIAIDNIERAADETIRDYILGPAMALALHQRGYLVLHGSAVLVKDRAVGFLGNKGVGKSTMTAGLNALGCSMITDDILAADFSSESIVLVSPGPPTVRLGDDSVAAICDLDDPCGGYVPGKRRYEIKHASLSSRHELAAVYILAEGEQCVIESIAPAEMILELTRNSYLAPVLQALDSLAENFTLCTQLINRTKVGVLRRPKKRSVFNDVLRLLEEDLVQV